MEPSSASAQSPAAPSVPPESSDTPAAASASTPPAKPVATFPTGMPEAIVFYCKDCHQISGVRRVGKQYVYTCVQCGTKNVAFGTEKSIRSFFRIKEEPVTP